MAIDLESENCSVQTLNRLLKMPISFLFLISSWMLLIFKHMVLLITGQGIFANEFFLLIRAHNSVFFAAQ